MDMREQKFGIEIELTGLTRQKAAEVIGKYLGNGHQYDGGYYEEYSAYDNQGRKWKVMYDSSIVARKKDGTPAGSEYKVEFVSPICECEFPYKSRVMGTSEPLKPLKAPYMARNSVKWGFFRLKRLEIPLKI